MNLALVCCVWMSAGPCIQPEKPPDESPTGRDDTLQILSALPSDTLAALVVPDLADFDDKLTKFAERCGASFSPYALVKATLEIPAGLDDTGPAALAVVTPQPGTSISENLVLLLPTLDRETVLTFLRPQPIESGGTVKATLRGRESYVGTKGAFTVFAPTLEVVHRIITAEADLGGRLSDYQRRRFSANDVMLWVSVTAKAFICPDASTAPWWCRLPDAGTVSQSRLENASIAARIGPRGILLEAHLVRGPGAATCAVTETTDSLLRGLAAEPFAVAMGLSAKCSDGRPGLSMDSVVSALAELGVVESAQVEAIRQGCTSITAEVVEASVGIALLPDGPGGRVGLTRVLRTDGTADTLLRDIEALTSLLATGPFVDARINQVASRIRYDRAAETSAGVSIDHLRVDLTNVEAADVAMIEKLFGAGGPVVRLGVVGRDRVAMTLGDGLARFAKVIETIRAGRAPLTRDPGIAESAGVVPAERSFEGYLAFDRCVEFVRQVYDAIGRLSSVPSVPRIDAPIAVTLRQVKPGLTQIEAFIPTAVVAAAKDIATHRTTASERPRP